VEGWLGHGGQDAIKGLFDLGADYRCERETRQVSVVAAPLSHRRYLLASIFRYLTQRAR
jgi:hypothetical protein